MLGKKTRRAAAAASLAICGASLGTAGSAQAQSRTDAPPAEVQRPLRGLLGIGVTRGGDTLVVVGYRNTNETTDMRAGGQIDLRGGVDWRLGEGPFSLQASVGYFSQSANGVDGRVRFERYPLELLGLWHGGERWRAGAGVRWVGDARLLGRGVASTIGTVKFKGKAGGVVEGEWLANRSVGFALRYVVEEYEAPSGEEVDGSHFGLRLNFYF